MEKTAPGCPTCGEKMTYFSSDIFTEHYMCAKCNRFVGIPRGVDFFAKSP
jgi:predicted RNA-binding Zn-ribbon protein involved in translation (DUF1610 family)